MNHKGTIQLETDRLILRKLKLEDAEEVFTNWSSDDAPDAGFNFACLQTNFLIPTSFIK